MGICKICGLEFKNLKGVIKHVNIKHGLTTKKYYDKFLKKEGEGKCKVCNNETTYRDANIGYLKTCSLECAHLDDDYRRKNSESMKGKKQSIEMINKRVLNTNQEKKELNRKKTMLKKYGVDNPMKLADVRKVVSAKLVGKKQLRTDEWQEKIITSKKNNGTLKHSNKTKEKISNSLNKFYSLNLDREKYLSLSNNGRHLCGWYNGLYFRSSLELSFLINNNDKKFTTCETKKYGVNYSYNGKIKTYFPDFTDGDLIYEIKPSNLLEFGYNSLKIKKAKEIFGEKYIIITELENPYVIKDSIIELIEKGNVVLTKKSEEILKKYKYHE